MLGSSKWTLKIWSWKMEVGQLFSCNVFQPPLTSSISFNCHQLIVTPMMSGLLEHFSRLNVTLNDALTSWKLQPIRGYIDAGDGCWRQNVLLTASRFWPPIFYIYEKVNVMMLSPTSLNCHHHKVIDITLSPTSLKPKSE